MAEGWAKYLKGEQYNFYSAGLETHGLNPNAVKVMAEKQVDISTHHSKTLNDLQNIKLDVVFTVCGHAHETCPIFPEQAKVIHVGFDDPPKLALNAKTDEEKLQAYRRIRDEIKVFIEEIDSHM